MASQDKIWHETDKRFINPYNFVSQLHEVERDIPHKGNLTGKINCTITVKTPLCIPDAEKKFADADFADMPEYNRHYVYDFYRVGDVPTIAGSRIKGIIRSYYEVLSNSCFYVNNNNIMSARHSFPRHPGLMKYDSQGWHLYPALKKPFRGNALKEGEVKRTWYEIHGKSLKSSVFSLAGDEIKCDNLDFAVEDYDKNLKIYEEGFYFKKYKQHLTYKITPDDSGRMYPVFYEIIDSEAGDTLVYLSPSQIGRSVFFHKIDDILESHVSCSKTDGTCLCKACALFGASSFYDRSSSQHYEKKWNRAGSLRFSDAVPLDGAFYSEKYITLKELSVPKTTSVEFYTQRPENALAWTYESKTTAYMKVKQGRRTSPAPKKIPCKVNLKGRKFYLHNPLLKKENYSANEKTKRNCSTELCKAGSQFSFDIYFENISESQLRELVWTLALGENSQDSNRMFKMGYAKPLGLGSVKITVNSIQTRIFDDEYVIRNIDPSEYMDDIPFDSDTEYFRQLMKITDFNTTKKFLENGAVMSYPIADDGRGSKNSKAHHQWFIANRSSGEGGNLMAWSLKYSLPDITDEDITLPAFEKYKK
ncbi:MAG: hypothetical protein J6I55_05900 [Ruminococcus sp.]|nr:hypothetical protein [Ruminococcus sp.]